MWTKGRWKDTGFECSRASSGESKGTMLVMRTSELYDRDFFEWTQCNAALLRSGAPGARELIERWQTSDVLVGAKEHRVPLRVACNAARNAARADARDLRRDARDRGDAA